MMQWELCSMSKGDMALKVKFNKIFGVINSNSFITVTIQTPHLARNKLGSFKIV